MSRRRRKQQKDALLQALLDRRPPGDEDFFVFSIALDSDEPTWDQRLTFSGSYEQTARLCVAALGAMAQSGSLKKSTVAIYQGQKAREYLADAFIQESRYQREREAQSRN